MLKEDLNDISELNEQIERALEDSNFIQLASLSSKLETIVEILTKNSHYKTNIKKKELDELKVTDPCGSVSSKNRAEV